MYSAFCLTSCFSPVRCFTGCSTAGMEAMTATIGTEKKEIKSERPAGIRPLVLAVVNALIFILFAFSFTRPKTYRDWRSLGAFSAFAVALFTEMYGFPLTVYLLSGWLASLYPGLDLFSHDAGHLWQTLLGLNGDPHVNPLHLVSDLLILSGFVVIGWAWRVLHRAQRGHVLATAGPYALVRHPQYAGFMLVMLGFLVQWPTLITLLMFPVLVTMYVRLARREEREVMAEFGEAYALYANSTPAFFPRFRKKPRYGNAENY
jgi:protein-S-isoprenylcysteine O-methyltransferase Ste14